MEIGEKEQAYRLLYGYCFRWILLINRETTKDGIHAANMGGTLIVWVYGLRWHTEDK